jgi:hypothetical protein
MSKPVPDNNDEAKKNVTKPKKKLVKKLVKKVVKKVKSTKSVPVETSVNTVPTEKKAVVKAVSHRKINNKPVLSSSTGINISPAKVKNIISKCVLNKEMYSAIDEIKNAEPKKIVKTVDGVSVTEDVKGTPLTELSEETCLYIERATQVYEKNQRLIYERKFVSDMDSIVRKSYSVKKNVAKTACVDECFNVEKFNVEFDPKFYDAYNSNVKSNQGKPEWTCALDKITKLKNRFSSNSRVLLAALIECLIKQLVLNGTVSCIDDKKKIIQLSHVLDTTKEGFEERFPLYSFISNFKSFKKAVQNMNSVSSDEKSSDNCVDFSIEGIPLDKQYQFRHYVGEICRDVRMGLCSKSDKPDESVYNYTSVSKVLKNFCSTVACEFLLKIGTMLKKEIETRQIKTVNDTIINAVISHYHTVCDVDETNTFEFINTSLTKYNTSVKQKFENKLKSNTDVTPVVVV